MWRRYGDDLYALLVLVVFSFEALTLGVLTWAFALSAARALGGGDLISVLVSSVAVTALALIMIGSYVIAYHVISTRRERHRRVLLDEWTARWVSVLFEGRKPPRGPLSPEGVETLLDLREHLTGAEGERVERLVRRYDIGRRLLDDREPAVRLMALRSLARSLARMRPGPRYDRAILGMAEVVMTSSLPAGAVEEAMLVLRAARTHPDRYARQMALQVLLDAGRLDGNDARALREAV